MADSDPQKIFNIQKIYLKDLSFESPRSPKVFTEAVTFSPKSKINLSWSSKQIGEIAYEVVLHITITATMDDKIVYLAEVQQAGFFRIENYSEEEMESLLGGYCPNILFPFARHVIAETISKGGFPVVLVQPMDFDRLYRHNKKQSIEQTENLGEQINVDTSE